MILKNLYVYYWCKICHVSSSANFVWATTDRASFLHATYKECPICKKQMMIKKMKGIINK